MLGAERLYWLRHSWLALVSRPSPFQASRYPALSGEGMFTAYPSLGLALYFRLGNQPEGPAFPHCASMGMVDSIPERVGAELVYPCVLSELQAANR